MIFECAATWHVRAAFRASAMTSSTWICSDQLMQLCQYEEGTLVLLLQPEELKAAELEKHIRCGSKQCRAAHSMAFPLGRETYAGGLTATFGPRQTFSLPRSLSSCLRRMSETSKSPTFEGSCITEGNHHIHVCGHGVLTTLYTLMLLRAVCLNLMKPLTERDDPIMYHNRP